MNQEPSGFIKGTAIKTIPVFVEKKFGGDGYQKWLDALPSESRDIFEGKIRISQWYDVLASAAAPTRAFCDLFYQGSLEGARQAGRFSAEWALRGIYRAMVRLGTPHWVTSRAAQLAGLYYKPCRLEVTKDGAKAVIVKLLEFPTTDPYVEQRMIGYTERATEISGARDVKTELLSSANEGDRHSSVRQSWE